MASQYGFYGYGGLEYAGPPVANSPVVEINGGQFPTIFLEIAPGYGPNNASPVWVNIASDAVQISTKRGRQRILGRFEAGTMSVTIDNKSGRYSPFNPASLYYNQIAPGMPIRFRALWGAVTYSEFSGFVETWPLGWPSANDSNVTITAVDAMKFLNLKKAGSIVAYPPVIAADAPRAWWRCNDPVGSTTLVDASGNGNTAATQTTNPSTTSMAGTWHFQDTPMLTADTSPSLFLGYHEVEFVGPLGITIDALASFSFEAWVSLQISDTAYFIEAQTASTTGFGLLFDGSHLVWSGPPGGSLGITGPSLAVNDQYHVVGTCTGGVGVNDTMTLFVNGEQVGQAQAGSAGWAGSFSSVRLGGTFGTVLDNPFGNGWLQEVAIYTYVLTPTQVRNHYNAGRYPRQLETTGARISYLASYSSIPTVQQAIDTGATTVQGATGKWLTGTILANMQDQADTEGGDLFIDAAGKLTFFNRYHTSRSPYSSVSLILGDSGVAPEEPYRLDSLTVSYDDQDIINDVTVTPDGLAPQNASDAASQTTYGKRTQTMASVASSVADAAGQATSTLNLNKSPVPRIDSVSVVPTDDPTMLFGPVLGSDLLTRMELLRRPKDGAGSTFDQTALIEGIEHRVTKGTWQTTWRLSSMDAFRFFILDDPVAGVLDDPLNILGY